MSTGNPFSSILRKQRDGGTINTEEGQGGLTLTGYGVGEDEIGILADIEVLVANYFGFEIANGYRGSTFDVDGVEIHRASKFELNRHGRVESVSQSSDDQGVSFRL